MSKVDIRSIRERLAKVYDLLYEAQQYCTTEWGELKNPEAYDRIDEAIKLLSEVLEELK